MGPSPTNNVINYFIYSNSVQKHVEGIEFRGSLHFNHRSNLNNWLKRGFLPAHVSDETVAKQKSKSQSYWRGHIDIILHVGLLDRQKTC